MGDYEVVRFYQRPEVPSRVVASDLRLREAMEHCDDPQTSSASATDPEVLAEAERLGPFFDGWRAT